MLATLSSELATEPPELATYKQEQIRIKMNTKQPKYQILTGWSLNSSAAIKESQGYLCCLFPNGKGGTHLQWVRKSKVFG